MSEEPVFEITDLDGEHYKIWANGRTEGFEKMSPRVVINRIPLLTAGLKEKNK